MNHSKFSLHTNFLVPYIVSRQVKNSADSEGTFVDHFYQGISMLAPGDEKVLEAVLKVLYYVVDDPAARVLIFSLAHDTFVVSACTYPM